MEPTPHPQWTLADAGACHERLSFYAALPQLEAKSWDNYRPQNGDIANWRTQALRDVSIFLSQLAAVPRPTIMPAELEKAILAEFKLAKTQLSQPMLAPQLNATIDAIEGAVRPAFDYCAEVQTWVTQNVPQ